MIQPVQILIIDDEPAERFLAKHTLNKFETRISLIIKEASNGTQGLQYISTASLHPDIILLDIQMPVMDGFEFLKVYEKLIFPKNHRPALYILSNAISDDLVLTQFVNKNLVKGVFEKPLTDDHVKKILSATSTCTL